MIDWECEVHKFYQEKNFGCDPSEFLSQRWAFSHENKCIVLEDDDVVSVSFFRFCKELLDKYENDERISMIAGMNHEEVTKDIPYDYFFTSNISIWGWASWSRVVLQWEPDYAFLKDSPTMSLLKGYIDDRGVRKDFLQLAHKHCETGTQYYETILSANMMLNSGLSIVPTKNMVNNIGFSGDSTHFTSSLKMMAKADRKIFEIRRFEVEFPLKHPKYVIENTGYRKRVYEIMAWNRPVDRLWRRIQAAVLKIRYLDFKGFTSSLYKNITGGKL